MTTYRNYGWQIKRKKNIKIVFLNFCFFFFWSWKKNILPKNIKNQTIQIFKIKKRREETKMRICRKKFFAVCNKILISSHTINTFTAKYCPSSSPICAKFSFVSILSKTSKLFNFYKLVDGRRSFERKKRKQNAVRRRIIRC